MDGGLGKGFKKLLFSALFLTTVSCGSPAGDGSTLDGVGAGEHRIFVTSSSFNGNLGGLAGADRKCQLAANSAGLSKTYKAVLGTSAFPAKQRLTLLGPVYIFSDDETKIEVVNLGVDLWGSFLLSPINLDQNYNRIFGAVWTGSNSEGDFDEDIHFTCSNWTSSLSSSTGSAGDPAITDDRWIEDPPASDCDLSNHLYCVSQ